ncbi:PDZ domain-containing protein [Salimicrobium flavidum]|uniref:PDZ domain-containing protein n=1 Tax=Salimicrobium flavidum TaxID=570947 RepID=A0A1N7J174_9BACI|nr:PDZ domain-containing protein [Salimicrobium flavidum]SIS43132.1 PDZ domain-containing protein [Salimicrobium flavidum]
MEVVNEALQAVIRLFLQPLFYITCAFSLILTYARIKKERRMFGVRIRPVLAEWTQRKSSVVYSLLFSLLFILAGVWVSSEFLLLMGAIAILLAFTKGFKWYSFIYIGGLAAFAVAPVERFLPWDVPVSLISVALLIAGLAFFESHHLKQLRRNESFPERLNSPRGKTLGQHRVRRLHWLPVVAIFPTGPLQDLFWFPLLEIGDGYGLIVLPLFSAFEWTARAELPVITAERLAGHMRILGSSVLVLAIAGYWYDPLVYISIAVAILGRVAVYVRGKRSGTSLFQDSSRGLRVLAVVTGTPAVKIGIEPGEIISKVNGVPVHTEKEFYEQLHFRGAFTKLEVRDLQGEIRHAGHGLYEGDHHELGVIFVRTSEAWTEDIGFTSYS